jgi:hypothetical protein
VDREFQRLGLRLAARAAQVVFEAFELGDDAVALFHVRLAIPRRLVGRHVERDVDEVPLGGLGAVSRTSSAQLAIEASERPLSRVATICAAGGESRCCAISAMIEWPSWPQARTSPVSTQTSAQTSAAAKASDLMADPSIFGEAASPM